MTLREIQMLDSVNLKMSLWKLKLRIQEATEPQLTTNQAVTTNPALLRKQKTWVTKPNKCRLEVEVRVPQKWINLRAKITTMTTLLMMILRWIKTIACKFQIAKSFRKRITQPSIKASTRETPWSILMWVLLHRFCLHLLEVIVKLPSIISKATLHKKISSHYQNTLLSIWLIVSRAWTSTSPTVAPWIKLCLAHKTWIGPKEILQVLELTLKVNLMTAKTQWTTTTLIFQNPIFPWARGLAWEIFRMQPGIWGINRLTSSIDRDHRQVRSPRRKRNSTPFKQISLRRMKIMSRRTLMKNFDNK